MKYRIWDGCDITGKRYYVGQEFNKDTELWEDVTSVSLHQSYVSQLLHDYIEENSSDDTEAV